MGKSAARQAERVQSEAADRFSKLAATLQNEATPDRAIARNYYTNVIKGGPEAFKSVAPQVTFMKKQFSNARQALRDRLPAGGAVNRGYKELASGEAAGVSDLFSRKVDEAVQRLTQIGQFGTSAGIEAGGQGVNAGNSLAQLAAQRANAVASGVGGIAGAFGTYFGSR